MKTRFSIIIPVYNVAPYLRECLDSVLAQTYADWEAICVDDGSTDGSGAILDEYERELENQVGAGDRRIKVIHQQNQGVSAARNKGIEEAKGEWILFLDGDDVWHPDTLRICSEMIKLGGEKTDIVNFARIKFPQNEQPKWPCLKRDYRMRELENGIVGEDLRYSFCTFAYRRDVACAERFSAYVVGEDLLYRAKCLNRAKRIVSTDNALFAYRTRIGSVSNSHLTFRKYCDRIKYLIQWLYLMVASSRRQPKGLLVRLVKDIVRAVLIFK